MGNTLTDDNLLQMLTQCHSQQATKLSSGQDPVFLCHVANTQLTIKQFKQPSSALKRWYDQTYRGGLRAERTWQIALHLQQRRIPTPAPIALIRDLESQIDYYISDYCPSSNFRDQLRHIYWHSKDNRALINLIKTVANGVRQLHDCGVTHGDLGNQNILLTRSVQDDNPDNAIYTDLQFIDLDRATIYPKLSIKQRAKDLARIKLPDDYRRIFYYMYFADGDIPAGFRRYADRYYAAYQRHDKTRWLRHPIRAYKGKQRTPEPHPDYPHDQDLWIWDDKSAQAMVILNKKSKNKYRDYRQYLAMAWHALTHYRQLKQHYHHNINKKFNKKINLSNKFTLALHPQIDYIEHELRLLDELKCRSVLIRFCHHESPKHWQTAINLIKLLYKKNIAISISLLQSREAITQPPSWDKFVHFVIPQLHDKVQWIEIGHAINRVKWGLWSIKDYQQLYQPFRLLCAQFPTLRLIGPAIIDFDWFNLSYALDKTPSGISLYAASNHLYVDRRGAPENKQGDYSTVEKCALGYSISSLSPHCDNRFIISESNWPLQDTGVYSPIGSPYCTPEWFRDRPGVNEQEYACYMIRYIAICLCSGYVDQLCWWRLSAHGYGLVDDLNDFKKRPAFYALKTFLALLGDAVFCERLESNSETYLLRFETDHRQIILAWCSTPENTISLTQYSSALRISLYGEEQKPPACIKLCTEPQYLILE